MDVENPQDCKVLLKSGSGFVGGPTSWFKCIKGSLTAVCEEMIGRFEMNQICGGFSLPSTGGSFDAGAATEAGRLGSWAPWKSIVLFPPGKCRKLPSLNVTYLDVPGS